MPLSYGGGITNLDQIHKLLAIGYEKVVINSGLITHPEVVREAVAQYGSQSIVASIDAKRLTMVINVPFVTDSNCWIKRLWNWLWKPNRWVVERLSSTP